MAMGNLIPTCINVLDDNFVDDEDICQHTKLVYLRDVNKMISVKGVFQFDSVDISIGGAKCGWCIMTIAPFVVHVSV